MRCHRSGRLGGRQRVGCGVDSLLWLPGLLRLLRRPGLLWLWVRPRPAELLEPVLRSLLPLLTALLSACSNNGRWKQRVDEERASVCSTVLLCGAVVHLQNMTKRHVSCLNLYCN